MRLRLKNKDPQKRIEEINEKTAWIRSWADDKPLLVPQWYKDLTKEKERILECIT